MSPRRSSRARTTQPLPSASHSSSSSTVSGPADRHARSSQKISSPRSSIAARSLSSEECASAQPTVEARRTRSRQDDTKDGAIAAVNNGHEDEGEEEITRCICANQEYLGLPVSPNDNGKGSSKDDSDPAVFTEDATGWFIQCDKCHVWQHGGCVGLLDEATSPEEYYCEQCHPDMHKITMTANGRRHSRYLRNSDADSSRSSPAPILKTNPKRSKDSKTAQLHAEKIAKGRRLTMNSRDSAYEEEQIRRAIEESKREGGATSSATGVCKGKRSRSESEEQNENAKRQRTTSGSASSNSQRKARQQLIESEEERQKPERTKNIRGAAARNHRNKEIRDQEAQRERERTEKDGGRRRTDQGRDDESEPSPPPLSTTTSTRDQKTNCIPFVAPAPPDRQQPKASHKKTGRPPAKKSRVGRNQYTKDRDPPSHTSIPVTNISPAHSSSSHNADSGTPHVNGSGYHEQNESGKPSKPRPHNANKTSMNDMKRRVAGILAFISNTHAEMTGAEAHTLTKSSTSTSSPSDTNGDAQNRSDISAKDVNAALRDLDSIDEVAFSALSSMEMMEVLIRRLKKWQAEHGKPGDKAT